jgi:hypothetical protein
MFDIYEAISSKKDSTPALSGLAGPWVSVAPESTAYPYLVIKPRGVEFKTCFGGSSTGTAEIEFAVYGEDESTVRTYHREIHQAFDNVVLDMPSPCYSTGSLRVSDMVTASGMDSSTGKTIYRAETVYRFFFGNLT